MMICETQTYTSQMAFYLDSPTDCKAFMKSMYPVEKAEEDAVKSQGKYYSLSVDSGYSQSCETPSSESEHWEFFNEVEAEDDVFTEKEVVLSYDGSEVVEANDENILFYNDTNDNESAGKGCKSEITNEFIEELKPEQVQDNSLANDLIISLSEQMSDEVRNMNINEITCTDSFLKWLDSEQDQNSLDYPDPYSSTSESNGFCGNDEEDSLDFKIELEQNTSPTSDYFSDYCYESQDTQTLPPIQTMVPSGSKMVHVFPSDRSKDSFNQLIRCSPTSLHLDNLVFGIKKTSGGYGHLLCKDMNSCEDDQPSYYGNLSNNQVVVSQARGELLEELARRNSIHNQTSTQFHTSDKCLLECRWEDCWAIFAGQAALVRHIEKTHVEMRRSDEFACLWQNCPRRTRPFNARYKLLIHMRVHSGEKPNKCPFPGCMKAFSRLENLKIHQRSHTGERPYSCQFPSCMKAFSNSSDRAKHQRTHYDTKPYACQVAGCRKRYTDPSSLRKHIKNHTGTTVFKNKKLIASEPIVTITKIEQTQRERLNSFVSDCTSDYQEDECLHNESVGELSDTEISDTLLEYVPYTSVKNLMNDTPKLNDLVPLTDDLDSTASIDNENFLSFNDEDMIRLFCK